MPAGDKRTEMLREWDVRRALVALAIPSIIGMVVNGIYNVVDTIFVGRLGTSAIGAVAVTFPFMVLISAAGIAVGMGSASYISRCLGREQKQEAERTAATAVGLVVVLGVSLMLLGMSQLEAVLRLFGATDTILPYAMSYAGTLLAATPLLMLKMTLNNMLRSEGSARASMIALITGAVLNIILDPIFIFTLGLGIRGAAVATVVSQSVAVVYQLWYYQSGRSYLRLAFEQLRPSKIILAQIFMIGLPLFLTQGLNSAAMALINTAARPYGDAAVAAMGVVKRVMMLGIFSIIGYSQGFQPVAGFNYGAKQFDRLAQAVRFSIVVTTTFTLTTAAVFLGFSEGVMGLFSRDPEVIAIGAQALRAYSIPFPLLGFQLVYFTLFQALGKALPAGILSMSRQGLLLIPAILILPRYFGLTGVILAQPLADGLTIVMTLGLAVFLNRRLRVEVAEAEAAAVHQSTRTAPEAG